MILLLQAHTRRYMRLLRRESALLAAAIRKIADAIFMKLELD